MAAHPGQHLQLPRLPRLSAHADEDHEDRDQRRGQQQDQAGGPVQGKDDAQDEQGNEHGDEHLRPVTGEITVQPIDLFEQRGHQAAAGLPGHPGRAERLHLVEQVAAQRRPDLRRRARPRLFPRPAGERPPSERKRQAVPVRRQFGERLAIHHQAMDQRGQQGRHDDDADALQHTGEDRQFAPGPSPDRQSVEPGLCRGVVAQLSFHLPAVLLSRTRLAARPHWWRHPLTGAPNKTPGRSRVSVLA